MLLSLFLFIQNSLGQNLIKNGGFENNIELNSNCYKTACELNDPRLIEPWVLVAPAPRFRINGGAQIQIEGRVSMHLNAPNPYAIRQTIKTKPSETYKVTFQIGTPVCSTHETKLVYVQADGSSRTTVVATYNEWNLVEYTFVASKEETFIEIGSATFGTSCGPRIDDVQVVAVPTEISSETTSSLPVTVNTKNNRISTGTIVAIIAGCVGSVFIVGVAIFGYKRYQNKKSIRNQNEYDVRSQNFWVTSSNQ
jgi:hypothetical protein